MKLQITKPAFLPPQKQLSAYQNIDMDILLSWDYAFDSYWLPVSLLAYPSQQSEHRWPGHRRNSPILKFRILGSSSDGPTNCHDCILGGGTTQDIQINDQLYMMNISHEIHSRHKWGIPLTYVYPWYLLCSTLGFLGIRMHKYPLYRAFLEQFPMTGYVGW